jgi:hypothetical protein
MLPRSATNNSDIFLQARRIVNDCYCVKESQPPTKRLVSMADPELAAKFARLRGETVDDSKPVASKESKKESKESKKESPTGASKKAAAPPKAKKTKDKKKGAGGFLGGLFSKKKKNEAPPQQTTDGSRVNPGIDAEFAAKLSKRRGEPEVR